MFTRLIHKLHNEKRISFREIYGELLIDWGDWELIKELLVLNFEIKKKNYHDIRTMIRQFDMFLKEILAINESIRESKHQ